jgi:hypothetical protein
MVVSDAGIQYSFFKRKFTIPFAAFPIRIMSKYNAMTILTAGTTKLVKMLLYEYHIYLLYLLKYALMKCQYLRIKRRRRSTI